MYPIWNGCASFPMSHPYILCLYFLETVCNSKKSIQLVETFPLILILIIEKTDWHEFGFDLNISSTGRWSIRPDWTKFTWSQTLKSWFLILELIKFQPSIPWQLIITNTTFCERVQNTTSQTKGHLYHVTDIVCKQ